MAEWTPWTTETIRDARDQIVTDKAGLVYRVRQGNYGWSIYQLLEFAQPGDQEIKLGVQDADIWAACYFLNERGAVLQEATRDR